MSWLYSSALFPHPALQFRLPLLPLHTHADIYKHWHLDSCMHADRNMSMHCHKDLGQHRQPYKHIWSTDTRHSLFYDQIKMFSQMIFPYPACQISAQILVASKYLTFMFLAFMHFAYLNPI